MHSPSALTWPQTQVHVSLLEVQAYRNGNGQLRNRTRPQRYQPFLEWSTWSSESLRGGLCKSILNSPLCYLTFANSKTPASFRKPPSYSIPTWIEEPSLLATEWNVASQKSDLSKILFSLNPVNSIEMETWGCVLNEEKCHGFTKFQQGCLTQTGLIRFFCGSRGFRKSNPIWIF